MSTSDLPKKAHFGRTGSRGTAFVIECFEFARKNQLFWNKWMTADCWMEVINRLIDIPKPMEFSVEQLNRAIGRNANYSAANINTTIQPNAFGLYKASYSTHDVGANGERNAKRITGYYSTTPGKLPVAPNTSTKWYNTLVRQLTSRETRSNTGNRVLPNVASLLAPAAPEGTPRKKRKVDLRPAVEMPSTAEGFNPFHRQGWWESPEAKSLFRILDCQNDSDDGTDCCIRSQVQWRIDKLTPAYSVCEGWRSVVSDFDASDLCSAHDIFCLQQKARYLSLSLRLALAQMPTKTWRECLQDAIELIQKCDGCSYVRNPETIRGWHRSFRLNNECFINPHLSRSKGRPLMPPLLHCYPDLPPLC